MEKRHPNEHFKVLETRIKNGKVFQQEDLLDDISLSGKTLVILCGNTTRSPMRASSYAYNAFKWLNESDVKNNMNIYSIFYPHDQPLFNNFTTNPEYDYKRLTKRVFKTAIKKDEKFLPADEIAKNLGNVVFFGHSVGGLIMNEMTDKLSEYLQSHSYSDEDIKKILSSIVFIGYSPFEFVNKPIKAVYIAPLFDSVGSTKKALSKLASDGNYVSSNPLVKLKNRTAHNYKTYENFLNGFIEAIKDDNVVYFANSKTLVSVPNLLIDDEYKEDHNLAGVIDYNRNPPPKTKAGLITTDFMHLVFKYGFETDREKFSTKQLFDLATNGLNAPTKITKETETNEEPLLV